MKSTPVSGLKKNYKLATVLSSICALILLIAVFYQAQYDAQWQRYQEAYRDTLIQNIRDERMQAAALRLPIEIKQITVPDLHLTDRCTSCHLGMENQKRTIRHALFRPHPGEHIQIHDINEYGCTTCHGGEGRALDSLQAHTKNQHSPFLAPEQIQSNCGKCHLKIFQPDFALDGAEDLVRGKNIFSTQGCLGCHKIRGTGGHIGPELTTQGTKIPEAYDFTYLSETQNISHWLRAHFIKPDSISPGSVMPAFNLAADSLDKLVIFTRALFPAELPFKYYASNVLKEYAHDRDPLQSEDLYALLCTSCHKTSGNGRDYLAERFGVPHISHPDFLRMASHAMIVMSLHEGRGARMMGAWNSEFSGTHISELRDLVTKIEAWKSNPPNYANVFTQTPDLEQGKEIFTQKCTMCHGDAGNGGIGPGLNRQAFLSAADNKYMYSTLITGRPNTAMPSWSDFSAHQLRSLISFLRAWQTKPNMPKMKITLNGNFTRGDSLYHYTCARCHGATGSGGIGPAILYPEFLAQSTNSFLYHTISSGRKQSAMFGLKAANITKTQQEQYAQDIIVFMRSWQDSVRNKIEPGANLGNPEYGKILYRRFCGECHGEAGLGTKAPALNNQEFLNAASNGYIIGTISLGRNNTRMPNWGNGSKEFPALPVRDRHDIVSYIRTWQKVDILIPDGLRSTR
jgi:mono/diheme cytochrome c family protein